MMIGPDFEALIAEAAISVEAAHVAAKSFSQHRTVVSADVAAMIWFLDEAAECLAKVRAAEGREGRRFPTGDAARATLVGIKRHGGAEYKAEYEIVREAEARSIVRPVNDNT